MKYKLKTWFLAALTLQLMASCGLVGLDPDTLPSLATSLHLDRDTVYLMKGEQLELNVTILPDSVSNRPLVWSMETDSVISLDNALVTAVDQGWCMVRVSSLYDMLEDSCMVCVLDTWQLDDLVSRQYLYETIVRARVSIHGTPMGRNAILAAFVNDQLRGVGTVSQRQGIDYVTLRVGGDSYDDDSPEANDWMRQIITFRLYDPDLHMMYEFPQEIPFDGESHGTLSQLFQLTL